MVLGRVADSIGKELSSVNEVSTKGLRVSSKDRQVP